ncbi:Hypothetical predicted protein [Mytilus galloprovincialis]|uniref:Integrase catalytic domain-containing protein n=1 Tax=Mytilus galloprovincialis TaxID=29158 RepID=A0A8B6HNN8_MYTGA|nr:Hypothetical predicted protein [Mytilus galloprovincialis]
MALVEANGPMERIATDILGELPETENGNKYILVVSDYYTKWTESFAMPNMEAKTVAKIIVEEVIVRFGVPHWIHSDQGRQFESLLFQEMCCILNIKKTRTTPYHSKSDGMVERLKKKNKQTLRTESDNSTFSSLETENNSVEDGPMDMIETPYVQDIAVHEPMLPEEDTQESNPEGRRTRRRSAWMADYIIK